MIREHFRGCSILFVLLLSLVVIAAGGEALADTFVVDDDGVQCPGAGYTTIQDAYAAASDSDIIEVCAGTYVVDTLYIFKELTFIGPQVGVDPREGRSGDEAVITTPTGSEDMIKPSDANITFDGFTFQGGNRALHTQGATDGLVIANNIFTQIYFGIWLDRAATSAIINQNLLTGNVSTEYKALIHIDAEDIIDLEMTDNLIIAAPYGYGVFAALGVNLDNAVISGNEIYGNNTGVHLESIDNSLIEANCFENNGYAGLMGAFHNVIITENTFIENDKVPYENPPGVFWSYGLIILDDYFGDIPSYDVTVDTNTFSMNYVGIRSLWNVNTATIAINNNCIYDNYTYGVMNNDTSANLDATVNWWGDPTGPYHPTTNPSGLGDEVTDYVNYAGWITEEPECPVCHPVECPCPELDGISPDTVSENPGEVDVTVTGVDFDDCLSPFHIKLKNDGNLAFLYDIVIVDENTITGTVDLSGYPCGMYDLIFGNDDCYVVLEDAFEIECVCPCPTLTDIDPDEGEENETVFVEITGTHFICNTFTIKIWDEEGSGDFANLQGLTVVDDNHVEGLFDLSGLEPGMYDLWLIGTGPCQYEIENAFEVTEEPWWPWCSVAPEGASGTANGLLTALILAAGLLVIRRRMRSR